MYRLNTKIRLTMLLFKWFWTILVSLGAPDWVRLIFGSVSFDWLRREQVWPTEKELAVRRRVCIFPLTLGKGLNLACEFLLLPIVVQAIQIKSSLFLYIMVQIHTNQINAFLARYHDLQYHVLRGYFKYAEKISSYMS